MKKQINDYKPFSHIVAELKNNSPYFPQVKSSYYKGFPKQEETRKNTTNEIVALLTTGNLFKGEKKYNEHTAFYASTFVRVKQHGTWYMVHLLESCILNDSTTEVELLTKFMESAYKILKLYKVNPTIDTIDPLQISEEQRLELQDWAK